MASATVRRAPYKDTLQPALHKRFSSTATLLLAVAYLEALVLASWGSLLWSWLPLGPAGIRAILIFACGLSTLVLRIAHYHAGLQTEAGIQTLKSALLSVKTYETLFWYGLSSSIFSPIYLWSMDDSASLRWIVYLSGDRAKLNERPLFLTCYLLSCALVQTMVHYRYDLDRLVFTMDSDKGSKSSSSKPLQAALDRLPTVLAGCLKQSAASLVLGLVLYFFMFRSFAWSWALMWLRPFYNLPKANLLPASWPVDVFLLLRCVFAGTMLNFIWATGNTAFSVFMARPPLKNGKPLTSESKDPNGSLLNGLKSKKLSIQCFAMWELSIISRDVAPRRQAIFTDIDRKDGPVWSQIYSICMSVLKNMEDRIDAYGKPVAAPGPLPVSVEQKQKTSAPLKEDDIFSKTSGTKSAAENTWNAIARSPGKSPMSDLSPIAKRTWKSAKDQVLTQTQQESLSPEHLKQKFEAAAFGILKIDSFGGLLQRRFRTEFAAAVLGGPFAEPMLYAHASSALANLAIHSLAEDQFGHVHRDVASIVRTLTALITKTEALKARFPFHWTDTTGSRDCLEVDEVVNAFREGLEAVVTKFEPYSSDLRLSAGDLRHAKAAITAPAQEVKAVTAVAEPVVSNPSAIAEKKEVKPRKRLEQRRPEMEQVR